MYRIKYSDDEINKLWNEYTYKRNIGLKKKANRLLDKLIEYINNLECTSRQEFVYFLCTQKFEKQIDLTLQQPLILKIVFPTLLASIEDRQMPQLRWLYQLRFFDRDAIKKIEEKMGTYSEYNILKLANEVAPDDLKTVQLLLNLYLDNLWFGSHHMPEYILIGRSDVESVKNKITDLFDKYSNSGIIKNKLISNFKYYVDLYNDWFSFHEKEQKITFREWCIQENKNYSWVKSYYYKKGRYR
jgi:hypothetical protein